ncbi:MAG: hypothetical protein JO316_22575 [Abitibacteriaceae bacterium]|nr:hypothetical protein [Abditibacteriaceae bacterium]
MLHNVSDILPILSDIAKCLLPGCLLVLVGIIYNTLQYRLAQRHHAQQAIALHSVTVEVD